MTSNPTTKLTASEFPVSVIIERQNVSGNRWISERWLANAVVAGEWVAKHQPTRREIRRDAMGELYLWTGFKLELFSDDADSYYFNLRGEKPSVFVVCHQDDEEESPQPVPFLITVSYDEAASYMEVDEPVFSVAMPAEVYVWLERYVVENYVPQQKKKRKRTRWHKDEKQRG